MEAVDNIITIGEKEPYVRRYIPKMLRDIIESMVEKIYNETNRKNII